MICKLRRVTELAGWLWGLGGLGVALDLVLLGLGALSRFTITIHLTVIRLVLLSLLLLLLIILQLLIMTAPSRAAPPSVTRRGVAGPGLRKQHNVARSVASSAGRSQARFLMRVNARDSMHGDLKRIRSALQSAPMNSVTRASETSLRSSYHTRSAHRYSRQWIDVYHNRYLNPYLSMFKHKDPALVC